MTSTDSSANRYRRRRLPSPVVFRFLLFPVVAIGLYPLFIAGSDDRSTMMQCIWTVALAYCWFCVGGSFHEAVHDNLFRHRGMNRLFGTLAGCLIFVPFSAYRATHQLHHSAMSSERDWELWPYSDPKRSIGFLRCFVLLDVVLAGFTSTWIYSRIYWVGDPPLPRAARRRITTEYVLLVLFWVTGGLLLWLILQATDRVPQTFHVSWILPPLLASSFNVVRKLIEHIGLNSTDPFRGTRTIIHGSVVSRAFRFFNFDLATHGPHHRYPKAPHSQLESRFCEFSAKHPDAQIPVFPSYFAALCDTLPCLWCNPRTGGQTSVSDHQPSGAAD